MFDWLKQLFSSYEPENEQQEQPETAETPVEKGISPEKPQEDTSFDLQEHIIEGVVRALRPLRGMKNLSGISVYSENPYCLAVIQNNEFAHELALAFDNADMSSFGLKRVAVVDSLPEDRQQLLTALEGKVYVSISKKAEPTRCSTARLVAVGDASALTQPEYLLDSKIKTTYHIGRGVHSSRNTLRFNDVVISNAFNTVSSEQADIVYHHGDFWLKACQGGCRALGGSPTKILTDGKTNELTDTQSMIRLHDGDIIELGKAVLIKFILS